MLGLVCCLEEIIKFKCFVVCFVWVIFVYFYDIKVLDWCFWYDLYVIWVYDVKVECCVYLFYVFCLFFFWFEFDLVGEWVEDFLYDEFVCEGEDDGVKGYKGDVLEFFVVLDVGCFWGFW